MKINTDKNRENDSKAIASNLSMTDASVKTEPFHFSALHEMANNSPQVKQLRAYQLMADMSSSRSVQLKDQETLPLMQQDQGRVKPAIQMKERVNINDDEQLEKEADDMGEKAMQMQFADPSPPGLSTLNFTASAEQPMQMAGWKRDTFLNKVVADGLPGVCNALSGAHLAGLINPGEDDTMGIDESNYEQIKFLKQLMDEIVGHFHNEGSAVVTFAFVDYIKTNGHDTSWLMALNEGKVKEEFEKFKRFFKNWNPDEEAYKEANVEDLNARITDENIYQTADDLLERFFDMNTNFQGLIVLKASYEDDESEDNFFAGHEMSIKYIAASYTFQIFDQNGGLTSKKITEQEEIAEIIADYIHPFYVANPMTGVNPWEDDEDKRYKKTNYIDVILQLYGN